MNEIASLEGIGLPKHLGLKTLDLGKGWLEMEMEISEVHMAPNGYLHAGSVVTLADTACGFGTRTSLPEGANGFTTIELKTNFLGTALKGTLICRAEADHLGGKTQVWSAEVTHKDTGKVIAMFRCTQMVLYPK
ncbi:PaaI family thioesterase [Flexibacterium corallicola]|uniref:PaaI family thioesterase n=1 Tax=Flexibacterium corallicola TaxID=3037259 RepID=UPI00286EE2E4|nr:PaaI family thioesterase [Pseudovibrio sp. M1P-2-3]